MLQCPRCGRQYSNEVLVCPKDQTPLQADATIADLPIDPLLFRVFDEKYRLNERLGGGGMGTVYRATHLLIDRPVAIKVLSQRFVGDETAQQRFRREARAAGRMQHPNAVGVTDFGTTSDGYLYIVMELLEGQTLRDVLLRDSPIDIARAVSIMLQTCAAVAAAHDVGLIHRDLKPANIFIAQRPDTPPIVKVLDFGVAKFAVEEQADDDYQTLTQVGALIGTPRYMSPEQCSGKGPITPASDVYSLGIILYEMLSGATPFNAETPLAIAFRHVTEPPPPLPTSVPEKLRAIVERALTKEPTRRFANAGELRHELLNAAEALGLEHAGTKATALSLENLRDSGAESPSGRLVIDIDKLREVQAATQRREATADGAEAALASPLRREISRLNIAAVAAPRERKQAYLAIAAIVLTIIILGSGVVAARWWRSGPAVPGAIATASPSPTPAASPTPAQSPTPTPEPNPAHHPSKPPEKPSKLKRVLHKLKGIFG